MHSIRMSLMAWYDHARRDLPWRRTTDPYSIWISEVILQQTRVGQGQDYYLNFIRRFPDVRALAHADEQDVLRLWQGLGYYTRARNLLKAARIIQEECGGQLPDTYESLAALPGIGEYTASAILSIAFNQSYPVVDGNVRRVISRLMAIASPVDSPKGRLAIYRTASRLVEGPDPGTFNQAIMEFGALYCKPLRPDCDHCVLNRHCGAYRRNLVSQIPVRIPKPDPRKRYLNYLVITVREPVSKIILNKRTSRDIWMNMYDFPVIESEALLNPDELIARPEFRRWFPGKSPPVTETGQTDHHVLSHQYLYAKYFLLSLEDLSGIHFQDTWTLANPDRMKEFPLPRLITRFLEKNPRVMGNK